MSKKTAKKFFKKVTAELLALTLVVSGICFAPPNATEVLASEGEAITADTSWYDEQTDATEFVITSAAELYGLAALVNGGTETFVGKVIKLGSDIDINSNWDASAETVTAPENVWTPIGSSSTVAFQGTFDGQGHTISGVYVNASSGDAGLFGYAYDSTIQNLCLTNSYFMGTATGMGSILGAGDGNLTNIYSDAVIVGAISYAGGLIGRVAQTSNSDTSCTIRNCWYAGDITSSTSAAAIYGGGFVGYAVHGTTTINSCLYTGALNVTTSSTSSSAYAGAGGFVGRSNASRTVAISDGLIAAEEISATTTGTAMVGSMVGRSQGTLSISTDNNVYALDTYSSVAGAGTSTDGTVTTLSASQLTGPAAYSNAGNLSFYANSNVDNSGCYWVVCNDGMPVLKSFAGDWVDVGWYYDDTTEDASYEINTVEEFYGLAALVNSGIDTFANKEVKLGSDINMNPNWDAYAETVTAPEKVWTPIGNSSSVAFQGTFDGQMHTISGVYVNASSGDAGLFGYAYDSTIQNFYLTNSYFTGTATGMGSIVGSGDGSLTTVYSDAVIAGTIAYAGGLIGRVAHTSNTDTACTITNCWYNGDIISSTSAANVYGGGLAGYAVQGTTTINSCLYTGTLNITSSSTSTSAYAGAGGFVGRSNASRTVVISDSLSAAESITATGAATTVVGSIMARSQGTLSISTDNNVYASDVCTTLVGVGTSTGGTITTLTVDELTGYAAYSNAANLSFYTSDSADSTDCYWVVRDDDVPALMSFVEVGVDFSWYYTTEDASYIISTAAELYGLAKIVNDGIDTFAGKEIKLDADIYLNPSWDASAEIVTAPKSVWIPIGNSSSVAFEGTFDGQGHTISGIYVNASSGDAGLFGYAYDSTIKNLHLTNSYFTGTASGMGSIVGTGEGNLTGIYSDAIMNGTFANVGGLIGRVIQTSDTDTVCTITNCWYDGDITSSSGEKNVHGGGLVGYAGKGITTISSCLYTGSLNVASTSTTDGAYACAGGFVGRSNASCTVAISDSLSTPESITATATGTATTLVGSIVGRSQGTLNISTDNNVYVSDTYATLVGEGTSTGGAINTLSMDQLTGPVAYNNAANLSFYSNGNADNTNCYWGVRANDVPALKDLTEDWIDVGWYYDADTDATSYVINTAEELAGLSAISKTYNFAGKTIYLGNDITVNEGNASDWANGINIPARNWTPISSGSTYFNGNFDGQGYTISGLYMVSSAQYAGLFRAITPNCTIKNLRLENCYFESTYTGGTAGFGSLVGLCQGHLNNVYSNAIMNCAGYDCGGLVGRVLGTGVIHNFTSCWFDGDITIAKARCGGIVGNQLIGTINMNYCLNTGTINSTYNPTDTSHAFVGGLCGTTNGSGAILNITECISAGKIAVINDKSVGSLVGRVNGSSTAGSSVVLDRVFATEECYGLTIGSKKNISTDEDGNEIAGTGGIVTGNVFTASENDRMIGYCKEMILTESGETITVEHPKAEEFSVDPIVKPIYAEVLTDSSTFTNNWIYRTDGIPVPKTFEDLIAADTIMNPATWDSELGLDYWTNISLKNAVDYGVGNYVMSIDASTIEGYTAKQLYDGYLTKLDAVNGVLYANNTAGTLDDDGVYNAIYTKGDWIINVTCVENMSMIYISVTTSGNFPLSPHMQPVAEASGSGTVSLSMTDLVVDDNGVYSANSFVIQLKNGHFIINDGGLEGEMENLIEYLYELKPASDEKPIIEAWTVSHLHSDHFALMRDLTEEMADKIIVEAFYISEPNDSAKLLEGEDFYSGVAKELANINLLKTSEGTVPEVYRYQTGQRYYFDGVTMDVILAQEQIPTVEYPYLTIIHDILDFNTTSVTLLFTTSDGQKIYIGGDSNTGNMEYIMEAYGDDSITLSNIDVFVALHHGKNTIQAETNYFINNPNNVKNATDADGNDIFKFDIVLFPISEMFPNTKWFPLSVETQQHLCSVAKNYYFISGSSVIDGVSGRVENVIFYFSSEGITEPTLESIDGL